MKKLYVSMTVGALAGLVFSSAALAEEVTSAELAAAVAADVATPVRPIGVNGQAAWNVRSVWFMYPPTFQFPESMPQNSSGVWMRVLDKNGTIHSVEYKGSDRVVSTESIWADIPVGMFTVWFDMGYVSYDPPRGSFEPMKGEAYWKAAPFDPAKDYGTAPRTFAEASAKACDYLLGLGFSANAYPSRQHSATASMAIRYAQVVTDAAKKEPALGLARTCVDDLILKSQPADAPLAYFAPTYEGEDADVCLLSSPFSVASASLELYEAVNEQKYLDYALNVAATYKRLQSPTDFTWALKMSFSTGEVLDSRRLTPTAAVSFFWKLFSLTGDTQWRTVADNAFSYIDNAQLRTWNWEDQGEDVADPYQNLAVHPPCQVARMILERWPNDTARRAQARELLRFAEDQFVCWERPFASLQLPIWGEFDEWRTLPTAVGQYHYREPVDGAVDEIVATLLKFHEVEKNPLDLAKAKVLGEALVRAQRDNGRIQTVWSERGDGVESDRTDSMAASASTLMALSKVLEVPPDETAPVLDAVTGSVDSEGRVTVSVTVSAGVGDVYVYFDGNKGSAVKIGSIDPEKGYPQVLSYDDYVLPSGSSVTFAAYAENEKGSKADVYGEGKLVVLPALADFGRKVSFALSDAAVAAVGSRTAADVPVAVRLSTAIEGFSYANLDATNPKIVFGRDDEVRLTEVYPHEIESWNTSGESIVWVKVPALAAGTAFTMYYGGTTDAGNDPAEVWTDYVGVWHMAEPSGAVADATGHNLTATPAGNATAQMVAAAGPVGNARVNQTSAQHNRLLVPSYDAYSVGGTFTLSMFFKPTAANNWFRLAGRSDNYNNKAWLDVQNNSGKLAEYYVGNTKITLPGAGQNVWTHLTLAIDGTSLQAYVDGAALDAATLGTAFVDNGKQFAIGGFSNGTEPSLIGLYDEVRLSKGAADADYAVLAYQAMQADFLAAGAVLQIGEGPEEPDEPEEPEEPEEPDTSVVWVDGSWTGTESGTEAEPFKTVANAMAAVSAGGTIYVKTGTYALSSTLAPSVDVTIAGAPGTTRDQVVISGNNACQILDAQDKHIRLSGLTLANGSLAGNGSAVKVSSATSASAGSLVISNCVISANSGNGACVWVSRIPAEVYDTTFANNRATANEAGAIRAYNGSALTVERCVFTGNSCGCTWAGGDVIHVSKNSGTADGSLTVRNSLFRGNGKSPASGERAVITCDAANGSGIATIESCTFAGNLSANGVLSLKSGSTVRNCLFVGNTAATAASGATLSEDSLVCAANAAKFDADGVTPAKDWADVVNQGANQDWMTGAKDLAGNARIFENTVDIGAYECQEEASGGDEPVDPPEPPPVDPDDPPAVEGLWVDTAWTGTASGTYAEPYQTLADAVAAAQSGGTIYFKKGTHSVSYTFKTFPVTLTIAGDPSAAPDEVVLTGDGSKQIIHVNSGNSGGLTFTGLTFKNGVNSSWEGGAISALSGALTIDRCRFVGNKAKSDAQVIYSTGATTVRNSVFVSNGDSQYTTCVAPYLLNLSGDSTVENCTFVQNKIGNAAGSIVVAQTAVRNCLFVANKRGPSDADPIPGETGSITDAKTKAANVFVQNLGDAQFESDGVTPLSTWTDVVDKGANQDWMTDATDLLGQGRICNGTVDVGAVELQGGEPPVPPPEEKAFYVDYNYKGGSSDGTSDKPFTTLNAAVTALDGAAGTIYLKKGTHKPGATVTLSASGVTIAGAPGTTRDQVILDGNSSIQIMKLTGGFTVSGLTFQWGRVNSPTYVQGAALHFKESASPSVVSNCVFSHNFLGYGNGGALYTMAPLTVVDSSFDSNTSTWEGGAVRQQGSSQLTVERCRFTGNTCSTKGSAGQYGNAISYDGSSSLVLRNSYFYNNGSYKSSANAGYHVVCVSAGSASVSGCTFTHNGGDGVAIWAKSGSVDNCLFVDNTKGSGVIASMSDAVSGATADGYSRCFTAAQAQFDEDGVTPLSTWTDVVDKGANQDWMTDATDLLGNVRVFNGVVDLGAVEFQNGEPPPPPEEKKLYVDYNASVESPDGSVDKPFKTIEAAVTALSGAGTVYLKSGTHRVPANVDLSANGVTISGAPETTRDEVVLGDVTGYNVMSLKGSFTVANLTIADVRVSNDEPGNAGAIRFGSSTGASVVSNCVFRNCAAAWQAGAINVQSPVTIVDCVFENNKTTWEGGAIQVIGANASLMVDRCRFTGNKTQNNAMVTSFTPRARASPARCATRISTRTATRPARPISPIMS